MLFEQLVLAASASAFMIIPVTDADAINALPVDAESFGVEKSSISRTVMVPCAQCQGADSKLKLEFKVEHGSRLLLNDHPFYPRPDPPAGDLVATLIDGDRHDEDKTLGYGLAMTPGKTDVYNQLQLVDLDLSIIQVDRQWVDNVPIVKTHVIKTVTGDLFIQDIELQENTKASCTGIICRAKSMAENMVNALGRLRGCVMRHGHRLGGLPGFPHMTEADKDELDDMMPPSTTGGDEHRRNWRLLLANIASHIILPVLMGVTAGVGVAVLAMVLCSVVIRLHRLVKSKRARRAQRAGGCCRKKQASRREADPVEKIGLMEALESEELPPQYQDEDEATNNNNNSTNN
ncbi:hypothetical protein CP533_2946 [Ophiocordyceps camponoti-saundersi (nom. inval.)]|nr:hypothetical protein CP533_2946 [Ophiocordyceps camponoti-saundersi (nom. inval.)]